jgi:membrane protein
LLNIARYNLLYGTLGNMIVLLVNVYFFFLFFFLGAQLAYVRDSFDILLFTRFRKSRSKNLMSRFYYPAGGNLRKYLQHYKKGEIIIRKNDISDRIFYIHTGEVDILTGSLDTEPIDILESGSFFGEMGYLLSENRNATVRARTDLSVFALPGSFFDDIMKSDTSLDRVLIEAMSSRFKRRANNQ